MKISQLCQFITIICLPLYIIRFFLPFEIPGVGFLPSTLLEILIWISFLATGVEFFKDGGKLSQLKTHFDLLIILFLAAAVISVLISPNLLGGLGILRAYFIEPILFFYCLVYTAKKIGINYIIYSLVISGVWLSVLGVIQKITGEFSLAPNEIIQGRISAVYNSANALALYLGPLIMISFWQFFKGDVKKKILFGALFLLFSIVMVWTRSRGGMIAEAGSLIIFFTTVVIAKYPKIKKFWVIVPILFILLVNLFFSQLYFMYNSLPPTYNQTFVKGDTLQIRYFIWAGTINLLKDHLIFGAGLNGFKQLYTQYKLPQYLENFQYPHNLVLTFWAETGILGLFAFLLLLVSSISLVIKKILKSDLLLAAVLLAIFSYWIIHGVVDVPYFKNDLSVQFWIILALVEVAGIKKVNI